MLLAALLLAAQPIPADCERWRSGSGLQDCPLERRSHDVLDAARRPPLQDLGRDAIRISTMPSLGGMAAIFEISDYGRSPLTARVYTLYGHPRLGWTIEESRSFSLQRVEYLRLVARVDSALTEYRTGAVADPDVIAVCTDGPGLVTERVVQGSVATLGGTCGWTEEGKHPNERILMLVTDLVCRHLGHEAASALRPYDRQLRRRCPG